MAQIAKTILIILISFLHQPIVSQKLDVKVVHLEARMMNVKLTSFEEEETMMVNHFVSTIKMTESRDFFLLIVDNITWLEVEVGRIEFECFRKIRHTATKMSQLVDWGWPLLEPAIFPYRTML